MQARRGLVFNQTHKWAVAATFVATLLLIATAWSQSETNPGEATVTPSIANTSPLDGRQFSAGIVRSDADEEGKKRPLGDKLFFSDGKFSSAVCRKYNFEEAPYWVRVEGDQVHFLAELTSPTDGRMLWKGTISGDTLVGTMRWTKKRWYWTIDTEHRIRGKLENGPSAASPSSN